MLSKESVRLPVGGAGDGVKAIGIHSLILACLEEHKMWGARRNCVGSVSLYSSF